MLFFQELYQHKKWGKKHENKKGIKGKKLVEITKLIEAKV
jgi:hypothetical protein